MVFFFNRQGHEGFAKDHKASFKEYSIIGQSSYSEFVILHEVYNLNLRLKTSKLTGFEEI